MPEVAYRAVLLAETKKSVSSAKMTSSSTRQDTHGFPRIPPTWSTPRALSGRPSGHFHHFKLSLDINYGLLTGLVDGDLVQKSAYMLVNV